ncbi:MAG: phosphoglucosamine mutase [Bdellovibrionales bacterium]|nr:phosphoglucosamine mutase [Bdellovibrionales bacterium]
MDKHERTFFGTDGIRGVAGARPLDSLSLVRLGKAIAKVFLGKAGKHRILIGKDTRLSGYMIETALASGITSMGADVMLVGPLPTPGVAYLTKSMRADAGVMISASHNPYNDNGIKIFASDGHKLPDQTESEIEALMAPGVLDEEGAPAAEIGKATRIEDAVGRYTVHLKNCFPRDLSMERLKIGIDCANGAGYLVAPQTFQELGAEVVARGISPNGRNINAGFGSLYPEISRKLVQEYSLDLAFALDGDADRVVAVDSNGNVLDGDMILGICARDMQDRGELRENRIVATVMSNLGLDRFLSSNGIEVLRAPVGDRYVLEEMRRSGVQLGGEQSGHVIFSEHSTTGDGILTALMLLSVMLRRNQSLAELVADFKRFPQKLLNIEVAKKPPLTSIDSIQEIIASKEQELGKSGRVLVRYSGTENKVRVMVECEDEDQCRAHATDIARVIEQEIGAL